MLVILLLVLLLASRAYHGNGNAAGFLTIPNSYALTMLASSSQGIPVPRRLSCTTSPTLDFKALWTGPHFARIQGIPPLTVTSWLLASPSPESVITRKSQILVLRSLNDLQAVLDPRAQGCHNSTEL